MPFDGRENPVVRALAATLAGFDGGPSTWCQHALRRGNAMCLAGRLSDACRDEDARTYGTVMLALSMAMPEQWQGHHPVRYNDDAMTTFEDVRDLIRRAMSMYQG
jgi:hypothetical protein